MNFANHYNDKNIKTNKYKCVGENIDYAELAYRQSYCALQMSRMALSGANRAISDSQVAIKKSVCLKASFDSTTVYPSPGGNIISGTVENGDRMITVTLIHNAGTIMSVPALYSNDNIAYTQFIQSFASTNNKIVVEIDLTGITITEKWQIVF